MIQLKDITKVYTKGAEEFTALRNVSFTIDKGDFCMVLGPSGAGKSTLLYIIGGLIHPDSGTMSYMGSDIYRYDEGKLNAYRKKDIGFIFQQFYLLPYLTVSENIKLTCRDESQSGRTDQLLEKCSLITMKNKLPSELSVGEKQRVAFIRAIISEPNILLADEPTGNLDPSNSRILMSLMKDFQSGGGTVVLVTHDPDLAGFSNRIIRLDKGMISEK